MVMYFINTFTLIIQIVLANFIQFILQLDSRKYVEKLLKPINKATDSFDEVFEVSRLNVITKSDKM